MKVTRPPHIFSYGVTYAKGYSKFTHLIDRAKFYTTLASAKRTVNKLNILEPTAKVEILYATMKVENIDDIVEKEILLT